jgi:hypothetical protein
VLVASALAIAAPSAAGDAAEPPLVLSGTALVKVSAAAARTFRGKDVMGFRAGWDLLEPNRGRRSCLAALVCLPSPAQCTLSVLATSRI